MTTKSPKANNAPLARLARRATVLLPLLIFVGAWQVFVAGQPDRSFFFGSPVGFARALSSGIANGELLWDTLITAGEAVAGFVVGNLLGTLAGLLLWYFPWLFRVMRPYIIALGTAPLFAFAPIIIVWFGIGFESKFVIAVLSTMFVALMQSYKGAEQVDEEFIKVIRSFGGGNAQVFRKVIVPASMEWVVSAFRLNIGLALLGAFLGEYISSERGLGHVILVAGGLYNIPLVLAGVFMIIILGWLLSWAVSISERPLKRFIVRAL
jgi:NitT/TauT family transport system permease protein